MKVRTFGLGIVLGVALAASPVFAQDPKGGGGAPGGGASERTGGGGAAANTGSGANGGNVSGGGFSAGGGSVATGGSSAGSSSSGISFNSPSGAGATASNLSFGDRGVREARPSHRPGYSAANGTNAGQSDGDQKATPRTASGGNSGGGERAVPRGSSAGSGNNNASGGSGGSGSNARVRTPPPSGNGDHNNSAGAREVPNWSRPRGDRPATGTAVDRVGPPPDKDHGGYYGGRYDSYYGGYYGSYYSPYYGASCGWGYYGCYYPWSFGLGYGLYSGFGWNPYMGDPTMMYGGGYYEGSGGYSSGVYNTRDQGSLKLKVKPRNAKVYVDGYFAGLVDQFDGAFQKLTLNGGRHKVEVRADGFETAEFDVLITPDQTVTFQGELKRIQ
jgi:hypothetical protein